MLREGFGKHAVLRERPEHATARKEVGVGGGNDGRENHEVEDARGVGDAEALENRHEGTLQDRRFFGRKKCCENDDRTDEKDDETHHRRANRHRDDALRVFRFTRRDADEFRSREGEEDGHHGCHHREDAVREGTRFGEVLEVGGGRAVGKRNDAEDGEAAQDDEDLNRHYLDEREDEFAFRKKPARKDVHAENEHAKDEAPEPDRRVGKPILHGEARAEKGRPDADRAGEPVEPRDGKAHARGNVLRRVEVEASGVGHRHAQFAERKHDEINERGTDEVGENGAERTDFADHKARVEKKTRSDHAAQGEHDQMSGLHRAFEGGVVHGVGRMRRCIGGHE